MEGAIEQATKLGLSTEEFDKIKNVLGKNPSQKELEIVSSVLSNNGSLNKTVNALGRLPEVKDLEAFTIAGDVIPVLSKSSMNQIASLLTVHTGDLSNAEVKKEVSKLAGSNQKELKRSSVNFDAFTGDQVIVSNLSLGLSEKSAFTPGVISLSKNNEMVQMPIKTLVELSSEVQISAPKRIADLEDFDIESILEPEDLREVAMSLLGNENFANDRLFSKVEATTDAGVVDLKDVNASLMLSVKSNPRYFRANPMKGVAISMIEAARDIVVSGGKPLMISNDLEILNEKSPELDWQFSEAMEGLKKISFALNTPIASNHISINGGAKMESDDANPMLSSIGMVGVLEKGKSVMTSNFKNKGDLIFILGDSEDCISSSEYLSSYHKVKSSPAPHLNLDKEIELQRTVKELIGKELVNAAHGISKGGLYIALTEMGLKNELGFDIVTDSEVREDAFLFGEGQSRVLVTVDEDQEDDFIEFMMAANTQFTLLGHVTKGKTVVDDVHFGFMNEAKDIYENALENTLNA